MDATSIHSPAAPSPDRSPRLPTSLSLSLTLLSALLLSASFHLPVLWFLPWFGLTPWLLVLMGATFRQSVLYSLLWGSVFNGLVNVWLIPTVRSLGPFSTTPDAPMTLWSFVAFLSLVVYQSLFQVLFGSGFWFYLTMARDRRLFLTVGALWLLTEWLRTLGPFGYPWCLLSSSQVACLPILQLVSICGPFGLSGLIAAVNGLIAHAIKNRNWKRLLGSSLWVLMLFSVGSCSLWLTLKREARSPKVTVGVVQANFGMERWLGNFGEDEVRQVLRVHVSLSRQAAEKGAQVVVWSETAVPRNFSRGDLLDPFFTDLVRLIERHRVSVIFGAPQRSDDRHYNGAFGLWADRGQVAGPTSYFKVRLVPFGEYVPFSDRWSSLIHWFPHQDPQTAPGSSLHPLSVGSGANGMTVPVLICFESLFPQHLWRLFRSPLYRKPIAFVAVITNDDWYRQGLAPHHHARAAVLRAVECRRAVVRAAGTGISLIVTPSGRIVSHLEMNKRGILIASIPLLTNRSFYYLVGDVPFLIGTGLLLVFPLIPPFIRLRTLNSYGTKPREDGEGR